MALQEDGEEARPQGSQILPVPAAAAAAALRRRCSPLAEEGSQTVVLVVVNAMVQHPRPMLLSACQARSRAPPPLP